MSRRFKRPCRIVGFCVSANVCRGLWPKPAVLAPRVIERRSGIHGGKYRCFFSVRFTADGSTFGNGSTSRRRVRRWALLPDQRNQRRGHRYLPF